MEKQAVRNRVVVLIAVLASACGASSGDDSAAGSGSGGVPVTSGSGGALGSGGSIASGSGGSIASGSGGAGHVTGSGGVTGSAGVTGSGGTTGSGGATAGSGGTDAGMAMADGGAVMGTLPPVQSVEEDGPYAVTVDMMAGANSWVFRPTDLGKDGVKHPIFVWGTGATSVPMQYMDHFTRVASHGFVVISPNNSSVDAAALKASLDWILAENDKADSVYYQKLNTAKIAMGGHSLGSIATFDQEAMETRLTTTIHIAGGSFDGMGSSKVKTPTAYMCGQMDLDIASPQCATDYENATQPTFFVQLEGIDHVGAARSALPGIVAWLRWWLAGETDRESMFIGPNCYFCKDIWANAQSKNW